MTSRLADGTTYTITAHLTPAVSKAYGLGIACLVVAAVWFTIWYNKQERNQQ